MRFANFLNEQPLSDVPEIFNNPLIFRAIEKNGKAAKSSPRTGTFVAEFFNVMNLTDFIIIYLACGTPFGVYHFIDNRKSNSHWLKSLLTVFVWIPYALRLLRQKYIERLLKLDSGKTKNLFPENEIALDKTIKELERLLIKDVKKFSTFEFRETVERYVGLTIANRAEKEKPTEKEKNLFEISGSDNKILAAKCLHRRNLKLLSFHHSLARKDFLKFILRQSEDISEAENFCNLLFKFIRLLKDEEAEREIKNNFAFVSQSEKEKAVTESEKELWTPEIQKQPLAEPIASPLKAMTARANLPFKD